MKHARKTSFRVQDEPRCGGDSRQNAAILTLAKKLDAAGGARRPTHAEIADLAVTMAREEYELGPRMEELFYWPACATPCRDPRRLFLPVVEKFKKKAEEQLRLHYAYYHALDVRRQRWLRAHPRPRGWAWTRQPLRQPVPIPKQRPCLPPGLAYPDALSPPA